MPVIDKSALVLLSALLITGCTGPQADDPEMHYNARHFELNNFDGKELRVAAKKMFPAGTHRKYVEDVLIGRGEAEISDYHEITTEQTLVAYHRAGPWLPEDQTVYVLYNGRGQVIATR